MKELNEQREKERNGKYFYVCVGGAATSGQSMSCLYREREGLGR